MNTVEDQCGDQVRSSCPQADLDLFCPTRCKCDFFSVERGQAVDCHLLQLEFNSVIQTQTSFFVPLQILLMVGTKLEVVIMEMATVIKGAPAVEPSNNLFWFNRPGRVLFLIHVTLFQVHV
jgi:hypothetical protein